jgi:hypothetical protein
MRGASGRKVIVFFFSGAALAASAFLLSSRRESEAYIERPMSLGAIVAQSTNIVVLELESVDRRENVLQFRKVKDLKGRHPSDRLTHHIGQSGFHAREWQTIMKWAEPRQLAILFHNGGASETYIDNYWYQCYGRDQFWRMTHAEPFLLRSFAGRASKLQVVVEAMLRGEEVEATCMVDGSKEDLQQRKARVQRLRASLSRQDYNPRRDFIGWGGEELEPLEGMAGFSHIAMLPRIDPDALGISAADHDGDGRLDLCLFGPARAVLLKNEGKLFTEVALPIAGGARSAAWADHDGDGKLDLLLACPLGPRLFSAAAAKGETVADRTRLLPSLGAWNLRAAAWIDAGGDGAPDIVLANGFHGLRLLRNAGGGRPFTDEGPLAAAEGVRSEQLSSGDLDGDGRSDLLLFSGGRVILLFSTPSGFRRSEDGEIEHGGDGGAALADFDRDGDLDLFLPSGGFGRLLENDGRGRFRDISRRAIGTVAGAHGAATSAAWGDIDLNGWPDLVVTSLRGPNRVLFNTSGKLEDATRRLGLEQRVFDSQAACLADFDGDGDLDLALANEGQDSCVLFGVPIESSRQPVEVVLPRGAAIGARVRILAPAGLELDAEVGGLQGRGCQAPPLLRAGLDSGSYRLEVRYSSGAKSEQEFTVEGAPLRVEARGG